VELTFRSPAGLSSLFRTPVVDVGAPSVNADLEVSLPDDRWVLAVGGPRLGPAVLVWSLALVLVLVGALLGRSPLTPLRPRHWVLLGLGFAPLSVPAAAVVAGLLFALGWRGNRFVTRRGWVHDLVQVALVIWTLVAIGVLFDVVKDGLLSAPDMQIEGNGSYRTSLRWAIDRAGGPLPGAWVVSVPLLAYHGAMLLWALWLASSLIKWTRWAWAAFSEGGLWRPLRGPRPAPPGPPPA
jgi:hypothetical protein